jgi:hypothetical protein
MLSRMLGAKPRLQRKGGENCMIRILVFYAFYLIKNNELRRKYSTY